MNRFNRLRSTIIYTVIILGATTMVASRVAAQTATATGKVTLRQADGTEVPATQAPGSRQVVSGKIKVNGQSVAPGFDIASGDTVETAKGSSAVVSLGKLGRVEVLPGSKMTVSFDASSITIKLAGGGARITKAQGMTATVSTKDAEVVAMTPLEAVFVVDTECGNTVVSTPTGTVELRAGNSVKQIAAGSQDTAGQALTGCKSTRQKISNASNNRP